MAKGLDLVGQRPSHAFGGSGPVERRAGQVRHNGPYPTADRMYSAVLTDIDGDGDLDILVSNDTPDRKLIYLNDVRPTFVSRASWAPLSGLRGTLPSPI
jgi:hypothetical protein